MTNLTDANRHLATQVAAQAYNMATKDASMETMSKSIQQLQGVIKILNSKQEGQITKKPNSSSHKKVNWWSNK